MDLVNEYCPQPFTKPGATPSFLVLFILSLPLIWLSPIVFKWWTGQRLSYAFFVTVESFLVTFMLDEEKQLPYVGRALINKFFLRLQTKIHTPPHHLMSSAPSNCPGILTVLKTPLSDHTPPSDVLTSNDFPVLPGQPRIFRTVDGYGNCPYSPHIGQAAQPYSYVMTSKKPTLDTAGEVVEPRQPNVDDIFTKLFMRNKFEPNEEGLNCLILDFATLLTHDLFNTHNGYNENSSYADLSPLYGNDADSARRVRKFKRGLLDLTKVPYSRSVAKTVKAKEDQLRRALDAKKRVANKNSVNDGGNEEVNDNKNCEKLMEEDYLSQLMLASDDNNWDWGFAGWRALVELFGREHNWVARHLLMWYPKEFSHRFNEERPRPEKDVMCESYETDGLERLNDDAADPAYNYGGVRARDDAAAGAAAHAILRDAQINDEKLYQTARYITTRVYANIILSDYASNFLGLDHLNDFFEGRPKQLGNCCSYEFGLLYHWHCLLPDETDTAEVTRGVPCPRANLNEERGPLDGDYYDEFDEEVPPKERSFVKLLNLKREKKPQPAGTGGQGGRGTAETAEPDETLAEFELHRPDTTLKLDRLLLSRYRTRIGRFGAFHTPKYMRAAETKTMEKARAQGVGSYNDFREHMGQMRCVTYEEINPDKEVAGALRTLYEPDGKSNTHVDDVELYPGVFAERSGRNGIKFGQMLSMGLLEDALNLIRNDRLVVDFDANTATPKGFQHAVSSHFADVIERNTGLRLVKQQEGSPQLVDYKSSFPRGDWRAWRLASCALLNVPEDSAKGRNAMFKKTKTQPGILAQFVDHAAYYKEWEAGNKKAPKDAQTEREEDRNKLKKPTVDVSGEGSEKSNGEKTPTGVIDGALDTPQENGSRTLRPRNGIA